MKDFLIVASAVGLMASALPASAAGTPENHAVAKAQTNLCDGAKGLMLNAYWEFLKQHPECMPTGTGPDGSIAASDYASRPTGVPSDCRLKRDIELLDVLENGIKLYGYRYLGDERCFVGVMAQDLLADARFRHAVQLGDDGFFRVDYTALGLTIFEAEQMMEAGEVDGALAA